MSLFSVAGLVVFAVLALINDRCYERAAASRLILAVIPAGHAITIAFAVAAALSKSAGIGDQIVAAVLMTLNLRCLNELTHFSVHLVRLRVRRLSRFDMFVLHAVTLLVRGESVAHRFRVHAIEHHPRATEEGDPTAAAVRRAATRSSSRFALFGHMFAGEVRAFTWGLLRRPGRPGWGPATFSLAFKLSALIVVMLHGIEPAFFLIALPLLLGYPAGMALSVLIEHNWAGRETRAPAPVLSSGRLAAETRRGFRLRCGSGGDRFLSLTVFPYGDLYHFAHSCYPMLAWYELRKADTEVRKSTGSGLFSSGLSDQSRGIVEKFGERTRSRAATALRPAGSATAGC